MSDHELPNQPTTTPEFVRELSRPALVLAESTSPENPQETDWEEFAALIRDGTKKILDPDTPHEHVRGWVETVNSMSVSQQLKVAYELQRFYGALSSRFSRLKPPKASKEAAPRLPKRRDETYVDTMLDRFPELGNFPIHELPENAEWMIRNYRKNDFVIGDMLRLFFNYGRVHPQNYLVVNNLLDDMLKAGKLSYDSDGRYHILQSNHEPDTAQAETAEPATEVVDALSLEEKLRSAGIGGGTGRPRGQVSSINGRQKAVDRRRGTK